MHVLDVESFYWSYICHAQAGSCMRFDDPLDQSMSTFEVSDQTPVDLFCCASVIGYENINIKMNEVGKTRDKIHVKRRQELDGSWVICANQHTFFTREYHTKQETLMCDLIIDDNIYSSFTTTIELIGNMIEIRLRKIPNIVFRYLAG